MLKKVNNNKGFTLIELLAVIVILGVLMIIAVPMVTKYIKQAKQDAFVDTAKNYINSARYGYLNGDYTKPDTCTTLDSGNGGTIYIKFRYIEVEKTGGKSSFNKTIVITLSFIELIFLYSCGKSIDFEEASRIIPSILFLFSALTRKALLPSLVVTISF